MKTTIHHHRNVLKILFAGSAWLFLSFVELWLVYGFIANSWAPAGAVWQSVSCPALQFP